MADPAVVRIFDTTLRDGEQSPGATMTFAEKLKVAEQLVRLNVDIIEAGFPAASPGDIVAVKEIARQTRGAAVAALARASISEIDAAWEAVRDAAFAINDIGPTSPAHFLFPSRQAPLDAEIRSYVQASFTAGR